MQTLRRCQTDLCCLSRHLHVGVAVAVAARGALRTPWATPLDSAGPKASRAGVERERASEFLTEGPRANPSRTYGGGLAEGRFGGTVVSRIHTLHGFRPSLT